MQKASEIDIKDTNMAMYRSQEHKDWAFDKASLEKEYKGAGDAPPGVQVWRVHNLKRKGNVSAKFGIEKVLVDEKEIGTFYSGDSYIVLETYMDGSKKAFNLYFWLGRESSQDEIGVAAYKTVELDDLLGDAPVQHRELDGFESEKFLRLFKQFNVLTGGYDSGFTKVKPEEFKPRLLHLKGAKKSTIVVREVESKRSSLNEGDSFILDTGKVIYIFNGTGAGIWEKTRAQQVGRTLTAALGRGGIKKKVIGSTDEDEKAFWDALGGFGEVPAAIPDERKREAKKPVAATRKALWKLSNASGSLKLTKVSEAPKKSDVTADDVFLLDLGTSVRVLIGSACDPVEKYAAFGVGINYLKANKLPANTPILRFIQDKNDGGFMGNLA